MSECVLPRDVPITPAYQDPNDSQRLWALGRDGDGPVFLTAFCGNPEWYVNWHPGPWSEYGVTPARVRLWAQMLYDELTNAPAPTAAPRGPTEEPK